MRVLLLVAALCLSGIVKAEVPDCYEIVGKQYNDGTTNKTGVMYDTNFVRGWAYERVQEMDDVQRGIARASESIAGLIGPCVKPNGTVFHMVDRPREKLDRRKP